MKTLSTPAALLPDRRTVERMNEDMSRMLPREFAGAVNLFANPLAGAAAFSALGVGLASHAFGIWFGAMTGAAEMSERLLRTIGDEMSSRTASFGDGRPSAELRAASAATALIAGARSAALSAVDAAPRRGTRRPGAGGEKASLVEAGPKEQPAPDDLKAIVGIGPKLEKVLNGLGVTRHAEIAAWEEADIARINAHLSFNGRIERDDWVGQARALVGSRRED